MIESHIQSTDDDDYEEGVDGTMMGNGLVVRYFLQGTLAGLPPKWAIAMPEMRNGS
jgi:hypothetical protein